MLTLVILAVAALSYANGANDNSKGVATLVGFGSASPRQALLWAMLTTALGAAFSFAFAGGMIEAFKSKIFLPGTTISTGFFAAVLIAAVAWVVFANFTGLPVSTTHAIVGGLVGAGLVAFGCHHVQWSFLGKSVAVPLVLGPLISTVLVYLLAWPVVAMIKLPRTQSVQVHSSQLVAVAASGETSVQSHTETTLTETRAPSPAANLIHWTSSGLVGFARGWNDAPKIAALSIVALTEAHVAKPAAVGFAIVTLCMAVGGVISGKRVLETLSRKLTPLPLPESLTASLTTAALVSAASWASLPVSTTHVATGAIVGAGIKNDPSQVKWTKVTEIATSWLITLPVSALVAALAMWLIRTSTH